ncbi:MAG: hypothetical protein ACI85O_003024 [Saprospiraceae bacterium]|jgi:hypothetical protein
MTTKYPELQSALERNNFVLKENETNITIEIVRSEETDVDINFRIALTLLFIGVLFLIFFKPMLIGALLLGAAVPYFLKVSKAKAGEANVHGKKVIIDKAKIRIGPDIDFFEVEKQDLRGISYKIDKKEKLVIGSILALTAINGQTNFELVQIVGMDAEVVEEDLKIIANGVVSIVT